VRGCVFLVFLTNRVVCEEGLDEVCSERDGISCPPLDVARRLVVWNLLHQLVILVVDGDALNLPSSALDQKFDKEQMEGVSHQDYALGAVLLEERDELVDCLLGADVVRVGVEFADSEVDHGIRK